jgi:hypothetical protein
VGFQEGQRGARIVSAICLVLATVFTTAPAPTAAASQPGPVARVAETAPGGFRLNLYRRGDFVSQYTATWCIGASVQMMANMVGATEDESRAAQRKYMVLARSLGRSARRMAGLPVPRGLVDDGVLRGAGSGGWARALQELGAGRYEQVAVDGYNAALKAAVDRLRRTKRPVGLIVWRGAHAWVMTGFTATADPLKDPAFRVTGVYVLDPWYPRVSSIWGPGQRPNTWLSAQALKQDFLPRRRGRWSPELQGKFVLVAPGVPIQRATPGRRMI